MPNGGRTAHAGQNIATTTNIKRHSCVKASMPMSYRPQHQHGLFESGPPGVSLEQPPQGPMINVAKLGDSKTCVVCGGVATLRIVQPSLATLGWVDDCSIPYDIPPMPMWQCPGTGRAPC